MGDGTEQNPYTRKDVLRLIRENGGKAEGLNLSGKWFKENINLNRLDLEGINLNKAVLWSATLKRANLGEAHLEKALLGYANLEGADLIDAHLEGAILGVADLEGARLSNTHLEGANLLGAYLQNALLWETKISHDTNLEGVNWGNYILGEEKAGFHGAADAYRRLKIWHTEHGLYNIAGKFYYREMEASRKDLTWREKPLKKLWSWVLRILCGYGEKPERVIISAVTIVFGLAAAYYLWGSFSSSSFADTLYYSVASFTALGYGQWAPQPTGWAKGVGAAEAVLGVSMLALFLVTFTRKMIR